MGAHHTWLVQGVCTHNINMRLLFSDVRRLLIPGLIAAIILGLDQITKAWALRTWPHPNTGEIPIIEGWLALTYVRNTGVAFGMFSGMPQLFTVTALIIIAAAIYLYLKHAPSDNRWLGVTLGLIIGGAIGNVIDRIRFGYVVDFIKTFDGAFPVFNIADSSIVIGVGLMILTMTVTEMHEGQPQRLSSIEAEDGH
jgi:signal peptidase II